jgi:hypothetical protein
VNEVTKDIQAEFQKEGEEKRAGIEGRINYLMMLSKVCYLQVISPFSL